MLSFYLESVVSAVFRTDYTLLKNIHYMLLEHILKEKHTLRLKEVNFITHINIIGSKKLPVPNYTTLYHLVLIFFGLKTLWGTF